MYYKYTKCRSYSCALQKSCSSILCMTDVSAYHTSDNKMVRDTHSTSVPVFQCVMDIHIYMATQAEIHA